MGCDRNAGGLQVFPLESLMADREQYFWNTYWQGQRSTLSAKTMTQILDRIKFEYLRAILPARGTTLEVGCGSGRLSCWLALAGYQTACLDFSANALQSARVNYAEANTQGTFLAGNAMELPMRDNSLDIVLSTGLLEHFADPSPIVREMVRVLKPGGLFYSDIVPRKFSLFRSLNWATNVRHLLHPVQGRQGTFYEGIFTGDEIRALLHMSGLSSVTVFPAGVVPPYIPVLYRSRMLREAQVRLVDCTQRFWKMFDRTCIAEWLGFYYFAWGTKPMCTGRS
jgi:2-polyprenyl-3-methyl-5-hydroxy-6-metoxy-1,4-benzoquinol methylase